MKADDFKKRSNSMMLKQHAQISQMSQITNQPQVELKLSEADTLALLVTLARPAQVNSRLLQAAIRYRKRNFGHI